VETKTSLCVSLRAAGLRIASIGLVAIATILSGHAGPAYAAAAYDRAPSAATASTGSVRLPGHTFTESLPAKAAVVDTNPLTLTLVLRHDDEAGFRRYLHDVYDPASPDFRHYLTPGEAAERFGPSQRVYDDIAAYLRAQNFELVDSSANRMTLTARASRRDVESAFAVHIDDYKDANRTFFANDADPALPGALAARVQAIAGLSNRAQPHALIHSLPPPNYFVCPAGRTADCDLYGPLCAVYAASRATGEYLMKLEGTRLAIKITSSRTTP
jgi:subtilase family serine protease